MTTEIVKINILFYNINEVQFSNLLEEYYGKALSFSAPTPVKWIFEVEFSGSRLSENEPEFASALDNAKEFFRILDEGFSKPKNNKIKK